LVKGKNITKYKEEAAYLILWNDYVSLWGAGLTAFSLTLKIKYTKKDGPHLYFNSNWGCNIFPVREGDQDFMIRLCCAKKRKSSISPWIYLTALDGTAFLVASVQLRLEESADPLAFIFGLRPRCILWQFHDNVF
jgi:hypothetical protein